MLPAGSSLECKYVIIDDSGAEVRWQEGSNMAIRVPATSHGLPVEKYDVQISWCKSSSSFTARPLTSVAAAAATIADRVASSSSSPSIAGSSAAVAVGATAASSSGNHAVTAAGAGAGAAEVTSLSSSSSSATKAVSGWVRAKGGTDPRAASHTALLPQGKQPIAQLAAPAAVTALLAEPQMAAATASGAAPGTVAPPASVLRQAQAVRVSAGVGDTRLPPSGVNSSSSAAAPAAINDLPSGSSSVGLAATLILAANSAARPSPPTFPQPAPTPAAAASAVSASAASVFPAGETAAAAQPSSFLQLTPASEEEPMSIVLPSRRSSSPPMKISLSSSFAVLMEMPSRSPSGSPSCSSGGAPPASAPAAASGASAAGSASPQSHPISSSSSSSPVSRPSSSSGSSGGSSPIRSRVSGSGALPQQPSAAWGLEYDMYATAYGAHYIHAPFDLDAYAVYDQSCPEPPATASSLPGASSIASEVSSMVAQAVTRGTDFLESAVQTARGSSSPSRVSSAGADGVSSSHSTAAVNGPAESSASPELLTTTAACTALFLAGCTPIPGAAPAAPRSASPARAASPKPNPTRSTATPGASVPATATQGALAGSGVAAFPQVSRVSPDMGDWASRTLMGLSASRALLEDEGDDGDDTDDEAAVAQALAAPSAPGEMTSLLQQLGTALGCSVRMRCEGVDAAAVDLLELDRKIALAASKLYRKKDNLLTGWVRKEARRQLAAAPAAGGSSRPGSSGGGANNVTPM